MIGIGFLAAVIAGGAASVVRFLVTQLFSGRRLPWAVFTVNVVASLLGGMFLGFADLGLVYGGLRILLLGGIAGGLSTFSTFSVETVQLVQEDRLRDALISVGGNLIVGVLAAAIGYGATVAIL